MTVNEKKYNILVIGKTGVGKSSFVNYFLGQDVAKTGTGKPVTERGFHEFSFAMEGFPVILYDSWGLEADKYQEWTEKFSVELKQRGVDKPATKWFHSVFYCIAAGGHRVEDADIEIIRLLQQEKYPVSVVLTKCDMIDADQEEKMKSSLKAALGNINAISMSSGGKNRSGPIEPFGIEAIRQQAKDDFFSSIAMRIPDHLRAYLRKELAEWKDLVDREIQQVGYFDMREIQKKVEGINKKYIPLITNAVKGELEDILKIYNKAMSIAGIPLHEDRNPKKKNMNYSWVEYLMFIPIALPVMGYMLVSGAKEKNKERLQEYFDDKHQEVGRKMLGWIDKVEENLISLRNNMHGS